MTKQINELRKLAATLDEAKREINLAREQCSRPNHLHVRSRRAAVQAARAVAAAVDLGFTEIWPQGPWTLSALRDADDPNRPPATFQTGNFKARLRSIRLGSGCNPDGTLRDDTALAIWMYQICPFMRCKRTTAKADAGEFDFPKMKTDDQGQFLGRDGKPLQLVEKTDPETDAPVGWELEAPIARVTDDYDAVDLMEHLRCQAADWADACEVAADLLYGESTGSGRAGIQPVGLANQGRKRRGRPKADYDTIQREASLAAEWAQARENDVYKAEFAKQKKMTATDLDKLLDRVAKRKSRSDK